MLFAFKSAELVLFLGSSKEEIDESELEDVSSIIFRMNNSKTQILTLKDLGR